MKAEATPGVGLRERKKQLSRAVIAQSAAELFARDGYRRVTMLQIAERSGVSEQTVYNYFPTKQSLVFDRQDELERTLVAAVVDRGPGRTIVGSFADWLGGFLFGDAVVHAIRNRGGMPKLVAAEDELRMQLIFVMHEASSRLAATLLATDELPEAPAQLLSDALLSVLIRSLEELGRSNDETDIVNVQARARAALSSIEVLEASWTTP